MSVVTVSATPMTNRKGNQVQTTIKVPGLLPADVLKAILTVLLSRYDSVMVRSASQQWIWLVCECAGEEPSCPTTSDD